MRTLLLPKPQPFLLWKSIRFYLREHFHRRAGNLPPPPVECDPGDDAHGVEGVHEVAAVVHALPDGLVVQDDAGQGGEVGGGGREQQVAVATAVL